MKIQVTSVNICEGGTEGPYIAAGVRAYGTGDIAAAIEAIENTGDTGQAFQALMRNNKELRQKNAEAEKATQKIAAILDGNTAMINSLVDTNDNLNKRIASADKVIADQVATIDRLEAENMREVASLVEFRRRLDNILRMARGV